MNIKSILIPFIVILLFCPASKANSTDGKDYKFSIKVVDASTSSPLSYATISVYKQIDSSLVNGGITDDLGKLNMSLNKDLYYVQISFIGYKTKTLNKVDMSKSDYDAGTISVYPDETTLKEVNVIAQKNEMEFKLDKKVFNVASDPTMKGANASDLLDNIPSVEVDVDGNVSLRGSQNVQILINGKPSGLVGSSPADALRQLQGSQIDHIEIITNPSAKYDAEGEAGIINIVLKEERHSGVNGSIELRAGYPENYGASLNMNMRKKDFNVFLNYGIGYQKNDRKGLSDQRFNLSDTSYSTHTDKLYQDKGISQNIGLGTDIFINKYNTLTLSGLYRFSNDDNYNEINYYDYDLNNALSSQSISKIMVLRMIIIKS